MKRPLRVCMLAYTFYETDNRVRRYSDALVKRGDEVDVIALGRPGELGTAEVAGVTVYRIQERKINEKRKFLYLARLLKFLLHSFGTLNRLHYRRRYDVVHVHNVPDFLVFATLVVKLAGGKVILDIHDILPEFYASKFRKSSASRGFRVLKTLERFSCRFADHVIISNHIWYERIVRRSAPKEKVSVLMNYPDPDIFFPLGRKPGGDGTVFVYPGSLGYHQGLDIAIRAFDLAKGAVPEAKLHIYGEGGDRSALEKMVNNLRLHRKVLFFDWVAVDRVAAELATADIGIVPKRDDSFGGEAFSTKVLEFMSMEIPAIVSGTKIDRYYFSNEVVRFFTPGDPESLAGAIIELATRPEERKRLVHNASEFVKGMKWDVRKAEYFKVIERLVSN
jgi:glycosyltransferase involved in cell wall biosynthesis